MSDFYIVLIHKILNYLNIHVFNVWISILFLPYTKDILTAVDLKMDVVFGGDFIKVIKRKYSNSKKSKL